MLPIVKMKKYLSTIINYNTLKNILRTEKKLYDDVNFMREQHSRQRGYRPVSHQTRTTHPHPATFARNTLFLFKYHTHINMSKLCLKKIFSQSRSRIYSTNFLGSVFCSSEPRVCSVLLLRNDLGYKTHKLSVSKYQNCDLFSCATRQDTPMLNFSW